MAELPGYSGGYHILSALSSICFENFYCVTQAQIFPSSNPRSIRDSSAPSWARITTKYTSVTYITMPSPSGPPTITLFLVYVLSYAANIFLINLGGRLALPPPLRLCWFWLPWTLSQLCWKFRNFSLDMSLDPSLVWLPWTHHILPPRSPSPRNLLWCLMFHLPFCCTPSPLPTLSCPSLWLVVQGWSSTYAICKIGCGQEWNSYNNDKSRISTPYAKVHTMGSETTGGGGGVWVILEDLGCNPSRSNN